jgi:hypothetical protein
MKRTWAMALVAMFVAVPAFAGWRTTLETDSVSEFGLAKNALFFSRSVEGERTDILARKHEDGWHEEVVVGEFPKYSLPNEELEVESVRNHSLIDTPNGVCLIRLPNTWE